MDPEKVIELPEGESPSTKSSTESESQRPLDPAQIKKLTRKCDAHVLPMISILYLLAFVDRINIGNAKIQGLEADLNMKDNAYNVALFTFFITYILFEWPSTILLKKIAPSTWLSFLMVSWGIVTVGMGLTQSFAGLVVCRLLLGALEAGFIPGCFYIISMYYPRHKLQWRISLFFCASILAGAFGGLFAYALAEMDGIASYRGWRWIFIMEGLLTVVVGVISKWFIVDWPETSKFLNAQDRKMLLLLLDDDRGEAKMDHLDKITLVRIFTDWKLYIGGLMYMGVVNTGYATSFFAPTILFELHWETQKAQCMLIPIYVASAIVTLCVAHTSDKLRHRYLFCMLGILVATIGYSILLAQKNFSSDAVKYFALYLVVIGGYITQPVTIVWLSNNVSGHYKRSTAAAVQVGIGNCGGLIASNVFLKTEAPTYPTGYGTSLGLLWFCGLMCTVLLTGLWLENRARDRGKRDHRLTFPADELHNLGDGHPSFRFTY